MNDDPGRQVFVAAVETRRLEIELFWRRSLFFWGFIAAAFYAFASSFEKHPIMALASISFGVICSLCWTLVNRGSKYWQENWETKVEQIERMVFSVPTFGRAEQPQDKGLWLSARRYSVSKLTIALSDFILLLWIGLFFYQCSVLFEWHYIQDRLRTRGALTICILTVVYVGAVVVCGRSSLPEEPAA